MSTLDRYIGRWLLVAFLLAAASLLALFTVFAFVDELGDVGKGQYGLWDAAEHLALTTPRRVQELTPVAALLGALLGLGVLASHSELTVMRVSGVSVWRLALAVTGAMSVPGLASLLLGEVVVPAAEELAEARRTSALTSNSAVVTGRGFWVREGRRFVNVRRVLADGGMEEVYFYDLDDAGRLTRAVRAAQAVPVEGAWRLEGVVESLLDAQRVTRREGLSESWRSPLSPDLVETAVMRPDRASTLELARYVEFLAANGQDPTPYAYALWARLTAPVTALALAVLAVPFVLGPLRSVGLGPRTLAGALGGVTFHIANQMTTHLGLVYGLPPALGATLPTFVVLALGVGWLGRVR
jgi:lipopolysaccharide export system permease protein